MAKEALDRTCRLIEALANEDNENLSLFRDIVFSAEQEEAFFECGECGKWLSGNMPSEQLCDHNEGCYFGENSVDRYVPKLSKTRRLTYVQTPFQPPVFAKAWHPHVMEKGRYYPQGCGLTCDECGQSIQENEYAETMSCHYCHYTDFGFQPGFDICGRCLGRSPPIPPKEDGTIVLWLDKCLDSDQRLPTAQASSFA